MKNMIHKLVIAVGLAGAALSHGAVTTQVVWQHHIDAWVARDVEAIVSDYEEDSLVLLNRQAYRGKAEIRQLFEKLFKLFDRAEMHEIDPAVVDGKLVYLTWRTKIDGVLHPVGTDSFFIDNGKILYQTVTSDGGLF